MRAPVRPPGATGRLVGAPSTTHLDIRVTPCGASPALQGLPGAAPGAMLPPSLNTWWWAPVIPPARRVARRSPPSAPLRRRTSPNPNSIHHHTACRRGEGDTFCDAAANSCCGSRLESAGLWRTIMAPPRPIARGGTLACRWGSNPCTSNDE